MKVIASIEEAVVIGKILQHLQEKGEYAAALKGAWAAAGRSGGDRIGIMRIGLQGNSLQAPPRIGRRRCVDTRCANPGWQDGGANVQ